MSELVYMEVEQHTDDQCGKLKLRLSSISGLRLLILSLNTQICPHSAAME